MRFGLFIPQGWRMDLAGIDPSLHWGVMDGLARRADENPQWESIWVYDHFHTVPVPSAEATHEAWTLMAAFAASTARVRLGQMCTCMSYRNPAYLAKVAATVDIVSGGRVEMGLDVGPQVEAIAFLRPNREKTATAREHVGRSSRCHVARHLLFQILGVGGIKDADVGLERVELF